MAGAHRRAVPRAPRLRRRRAGQRRSGARPRPDHRRARGDGHRAARRGGRPGHTRTGQEGARDPGPRMGRAGPAPRVPRAAAGQQHRRARAAQPGGGSQELLRIGLGRLRRAGRPGLDHHRDRRPRRHQPAALPHRLPRRLRRRRRQTTRRRGTGPVPALRGHRHRPGPLAQPSPARPATPPALAPPDTVRYCGRTFTATELALLRELAATLPTRRAIADAACDALGWTRPDGRRKDMSARVALLRMAEDGLLTLPPPRTGNANRRWPPHLAAGAEPFPVHTSLAELRPLRIRLISSAAESKTWNTQVATHHYLGYSPLPGAQLRYLIESDTCL